MSFYKYTPALLEPKILEDTLIGRDMELDNLKRILKSASSGRSISHAILIGPKGIGKTHVLQILYHAVRGDIKTKNINTYKKKFIPVIFPEEEYYGNTIKFIMWTLRYLAESKPEGIPLIPEELIKPVTLDNKQKELALSYLKTFKKKTGKILLLLVDNLNEIIERFTDEDQSSLREVLMTYDSILLIGSAPTLFDSIINHDKPLYNFFEVIWLKDLSFDDGIALLKRYAEIEGKNELIEKFKESEPKLRAIHELAGGNPRLILSLYHIIVEGDITSVETTFLKLLDDLSPYFSLRMKDLSSQQSEIIEVIASAEKLLTPTEISARCYMPVNIVNSQLKRLEKIGYISKLPKKHVKRVLYDLNEKLFRLWRQMRVEAGRRRLGFIVKFLEIWFTKKELFAYLDKTLCEIREKLSFDNIEIKYNMDKLWYIKEAIPEFKGGDEICVACHRKDYDAALKMIKKALNVKPDDTEMLYKGGCIYTKLKQYDEAIQAYKKTIELKPDMHEAWYSLGNVDAIHRKRYDEAIEAYKKAIELKPDKHEAWHNLGNTYTKLKQYDEAIEAYKKTIELKPDKHEAWYSLGNTYTKLKQYDEAIEAYKKTIELKPDMHEAWYSLGNTYTKLKQYDEAIEAYKKAIELKPDKHEAWYNLGNVDAIHRKRYDEAIEAYKKAIELKPDKHEAWYNLGNTYTKLKQYDEAIQAFKKAIELKPDKHEPWYNLGNTYTKLKQYDEAIEAYKKTIELKPDKHEAWYNLGNTYTEFKQYDEAIQAFKKAIELKPDKHEPWYNLGNTYTEFKQYDEAIQAFKKAIELKPDKHEAWYNLGYIYTILDRFYEALEACKKSIEIRSDDNGAWYIKGQAYLGIKKFANALEAFKKAIKIKHCKHCEHGAWIGLGITYIFLFKDEGTKGHIDSSIKNLKESLNCLSSISEKDEIFDSYAETFKILIKAKKVDLIKIALNEIEVGNQNDLLEFLSPYSVFIKYLETKDSEIIERLRHEERIVVEDMIRMVEGKNKEKLKQKNQKLILGRNK